MMLILVGTSSRGRVLYKHYCNPSMPACMRPPDLAAWCKVILPPLLRCDARTLRCAYNIYLSPPTHLIWHEATDDERACKTALELRCWAAFDGDNVLDLRLHLQRLEFLGALDQTV